ncbi:MAG: restriction endonuclease subunit S [Akkermansia sp.]|nr:restriction endonuclease subunit S [Akkermansia sp.]
MSRQMKDSGIPYLGPVPASWDVQKLRYSVKWKSEKGYPDAEVLALYRDYGVIPKSSRDDNHNVTSLDTSTYKYVEIGDFVINKMKAWQGSMGVSSYSGIISPAYHVCSITNDDIHRPYFHYLLRNVAYLPEFARLSTGLRIGQWDLSFDDFRNLPFLLPDKSEQERIANLLDTKCADIDKVIEQTCATIEEYKKLKQAIITEAVTKGVRGPRPMKPSGVEWIGDIPVGWYTSKAGRFIASTQNGLTRRDLSESSGDIVLKLRNITPDGTIDYSAVTRVKLSDAEKTAYTLEKGDFLFVRVNGSKSLVGKSAIFDGSDEDVAYNDHIIRVRLETNYSRAYFKWFLLSTPGKTEIDMRTSTSAGQFTISGQELRNIRLCVPSEEEQQEIATYLDTKCAEIDRIIEKKEQLIEELGSYKKSLIYEYVTGKKEVTA